MIMMYHHIEGRKETKAMYLAHSTTESLFRFDQIFAQFFSGEGLVMVLDVDISFFTFINLIFGDLSNLLCMSYSQYSNIVQKVIPIATNSRETVILTHMTLN